MPSGQETDSAYSIMAPGPTQALCCMKKQQLVPIPKVGVSVVCLTVHVTAGIHLYLTGATACNSKLTCSRTLHTLYFNPSLQISCTVYSEQNR